MALLKRIANTLLIAIGLKILTTLFDILFGLVISGSSSDCDIPTASLIVDICIIGPIIEELTFRLPLGQQDIRKMFLSLSLFITFVIVRYVDILSVCEDPLIVSLVHIVMASGTFGALWILINRTVRIRLKNPIGVLPMFVTSIVFGLVHINSTTQLLSDLIAIIPLVFLGFILAIVRIRYGFGYAILLHFIYNLPTAVVLYTSQP